MWADLKRYLRRRRSTTLQSLIGNVRRFETKLTPEYCQRYVMHEREVLKAIIRKRGAWSDH